MTNLNRGIGRVNPGLLAAAATFLLVKPPEVPEPIATSYGRPKGNKYSGRPDPVSPSNFGYRPSMGADQVMREGSTGEIKKQKIHKNRPPGWKKRQRRKNRG